MENIEHRLKQILNNKGGLIHEFSESDFGKFVITGPQMGGGVNERIGRLVQVRLEHGCYGSETVFLRHPNNSLSTHENQFFFRVKEEDLPEVESIFSETYKDDPFKHSYSIGGKKKCKGFIVASKIKEGQTTPIRQVKAEIEHSLAKIIVTTT